MNSYPGDQRPFPSAFDASDASASYQSAEVGQDGRPSISLSPPEDKSVSPQPAPNNASLGSSAATRIRRRNRMITSCLECRRRKLKCDKSHPCVNCTKFKRECVFLSKDMDSASQLKLTEIKEKVGSLERLLERDVARPPGATLKKEADDGDELSAAEDEKDMEPSPLGVIDAAYEEDADDDDHMLDLGVQIGKMRITERIGGFVRPKMSEELKHGTFEHPEAPQDPSPGPLSPELETPGEQQYSFLKPGPSYIAPASGFFFGQMGTSQPSLFDFLPSRLAADRLIKQYFEAVHPVARITHQPSFERDYESFWEDVTLGIEPPPSLQTVVFAAMFSGVVSMDDAVISRDFGVSKQSLIDNFKLGTETALGRAHFLRTTRLATLQGFVMYLIPLCRAEVSRAHSVLVGAAIRMAECMSLHRDGEHYGLNPLETHVRRLIWYQLCFLDIRTCEAQGPRPSIRKDDFDTKIPLNVEDVDLHPGGKPPTVVDRFTGATYSLIRFECVEMQRQLWVDRPRLEARKTSLTSVLTKIETFKKTMAAKYDHLMDERIPLQRAAKIMKACLCTRLNVMALHRYHNAVKSGMPHRLRLILVASAVAMLEAGIAMDTLPDLATWRWYVGAYMQYQAGFLLLVDPLFYDTPVEVDRVWKCLDYIFETDITKSREEKSRIVLEEIQSKLATFEARRKIRAPPGMQKYIRDKTSKTRQASSSRRPSDQNSPLNFVNTDGLSPSVGKMSMYMPPTGMVGYAAVPSVEPNWVVPPLQQSQSMGSPSDSSVRSYGNSGNVTMTGPSMMGIGSMGMAAGAAAPPAGQSDDLMAEIDWDAFDALFPPDQQMNDLFPPGFSSTAMQFTF